MARMFSASVSGGGSRVLAESALSRLSPKLVQCSMGSSEEVLCFKVRSSNESSVRFLMLNRPKALHALTVEMCRAMAFTIHQQYGGNNSMRKSLLILMSSTPGRAFCAGGDVKHITQQASEGNIQEAETFFRAEYTLDHALSSVPRVSILDGVCMGGGMGLVMHANKNCFSFRVATTHTVCALPETTIGFHPDVGASHFLSRLRSTSPSSPAAGTGAIGMWLALTGQHVRGADLLHTGLATHFVDHQKVHDLVDALVEYTTHNNKSADCEASRFRQDVDEIIRSFEDDSTRALREEDGLAWMHEAVVNECFGLEKSESVQSCVSKLQEFAKLGNSAGSFARAALEKMEANSPQSMRIAFESLRQARAETLEQALCREFRASMHLSVACKDQQGDFFKGVESVLVKREKSSTPGWNTCMNENSSTNSANPTAAFFEPVPGISDWAPGNSLSKL